jgi:hypothetical protein
MSERSEPVAWGVMRVTGIGGRFMKAFLTQEVATEYAVENDALENWAHEIVPLYRSPTLTDAECKALDRAAFLAQAAGLV